jgi:GTP-binding protein Era
VSRPTLDVAVYGIINAGKSSLINALSRRQVRAAGPIGGTTAEVAGVTWRVIESERGPERMTSPEAPSPQPSPTRGEGDGTGLLLSDPLPPRGGGLGRGGPDDAVEASPAPSYTVRLIDTPGLEEVGDEGRGHLATAAARDADLVLFVLAEDLTATARRALVGLREVGKPIVVALNKVDLLGPEERDAVLGAVRSGLAGLIPEEDILPIAAAPIVRRRVELAHGAYRVETVRGEPEVGELEARLVAALAASAADLRDLARASSEVERHVRDREADRARLRDRAERVADETSLALALALAVNPVPLLDFLTGPGGLTILVRRVAEVYGEPMTAEVARGLAGDLIRGGRVALWGPLAATFVGGAFKLVPGVGHLAGALTQGASAGYFGHVVGRALVGYLDRGHDWGDGGLVAALDRIAASTDRKALTRGLVDRIRARLRGAP